MADIGFARQAWEEHFAPVAEMGYWLERVDVARYWALHEQHLRQHFPPELFIDLRGLNTEHERRGQQRIAEATEDARLTDHCIGWSGDAPVLFFSGEQRTPSIYRMWHTHVHPSHRRRGVYRAILAASIGYTGALGFDTIISEHAPGNNPVIIAKLKAGFRIVAMEVDPLVGVSVVLKYFHNADHLATYQFRCGLATVTPRMLEHAHGAMPLLREQLR